MIQFSLDTAVMHLFAFSNYIKCIHIPDRHHAFIIRTADDFRYQFTDIGEFLLQHGFDLFQRLVGGDIQIKRIPGVHLGHIQNVFDALITEDLNIISDSYQFG